MKKVCSKCGIEKLLDCFHAAAGCRNGFRSECKICRNKYRRMHYRINHEHALEYRRKYYRAHKKECKAQSVKWAKANPEKIKQRGESKIQYERKRRKNPKIKINNLMSSMIRQCLKGAKGGRSWESLVGYTKEDLIKHLKATIKKPYSWKDFVDGKIKFHVDHKIPVSVFNFTKPEHIDFKRCWALKNLRLILAQDNLRKCAKLAKHFQPNFLLET